jgi:hypothetical protein
MIQKYSCSNEMTVKKQIRNLCSRLSTYGKCDLMRINAKSYCFRLSKADQEQQHAVVKAEIVTHRQDRIQAKPQSSNIKTSICTIQ